MPLSAIRLCALLVLYLASMPPVLAQMVCAVMKQDASDKAAGGGVTTAARDVVRRTVESALPPPATASGGSAKSWRVRWVQNASSDFAFECFQVVVTLTAAAGGSVNATAGTLEGLVDLDVHSTLTAGPLRLVDGSDQLRIVDPGISGGRNGVLAVTVVNRQYNLDTIAALGVLLGVALATALVVGLCCWWRHRGVGRDYYGGDASMVAPRRSFRSGGEGAPPSFRHRQRPHDSSSGTNQPPTALDGDEDGESMEGFGGGDDDAAAEYDELNRTGGRTRTKRTASPFIPLRNPSQPDEDHKVYLQSDESWSDTAGAFGLSEALVSQLRSLGVRSRWDLIQLFSPTESQQEEEGRCTNRTFVSSQPQGGDADAQSSLSSKSEARAAAALRSLDCGPDDRRRLRQLALFLNASTRVSS